MSRRKKEQSFSTRCTEPARCPVVCELSVVARSPKLPACPHVRLPAFLFFVLDLFKVCRNALLKVCGVALQVTTQ